MSDIFTLLLDAVPASIDAELIVLLMAIGAIIKHTKKFEKISNKLIPVILAVVSLIVCLVSLDTYTTNTIIDAIINGLVNAAGAVYCHQVGKNVFVKDTVSITENSETTETVESSDE